MQYSTTRKVRITFFIALFFVFAISILSYTSISKLTETSRLVDKAQTMMFHLGQLHVSVKEAETAQRAYLITGDTTFLNTYYQWKETSEDQQKELSSMMEEYPGQAKNFQELERLINARFDRLQNIITQYHAGMPLDLEVSNQTMNSLREVIFRMSREEDELLDMRREQEQLHAWQAFAFIILFSIVTFLLILFAFFRIRKDIRSRIEAEQKLSENNLLLEEKVKERTREISRNEERYRFMAESIPHIVWTANPEGEMDFFSQKLAMLTGVPTEEMLGRKWMAVIHPDDQELTMETLSRALENGQEERVTHRVLSQEGAYKWAETRGIPFRNEEGEVIKWFGTTTIIDDEVKAKEAARQQEELLKDITDSLPVLIAYMDKEFRYRFVNLTYEKWFRKSRDQILNQYAWDVIGEIGFGRVKPFLELAFSGQKVSSEVETYYEHLGERFIKFDFVPRYEGSKVIGTYMLVTDVSKIKKIENDLRETLLNVEVSNLELKRINQVLDDFVSMAAHDLKSPVSNLKLTMLLIDKLKDDKEKLKVVNHLEGSINRLDNTLKGLLEIVEVQHVKNAKVVYCEFKEVLEEVLINLQENLKEAGGELVRDFESCPAVYYIRPYLVSIMSNLLSNAIKYSSEDRPAFIEVSTEPVGEGVLLRFRDNGIGMDIERIGNKLFKPFKRFSSKAEGTGVGLHLVKSIIERNGGNIRVESAVGVGTTFECFLKNIQINEAEL